MKVLIDTNIILDVLCDRANFSEASAKILKLCEVKKIDGYVSALSIPNIVYIMRKELDAGKIREILERLTMIITIADLKADDIKKAAYLDFKDYEDALQSVCASRMKLNFIVTRNIKDFVTSKVTAITPLELIDRM